MLPAWLQPEWFQRGSNLRRLPDANRFATVPLSSVLSAAALSLTASLLTASLLTAAEPTPAKPVAGSTGAVTQDASLRWQAKNALRKVGSGDVEPAALSSAVVSAAAEKPKAATRDAKLPARASQAVATREATLEAAAVQEAAFQDVVPQDTQSSDASPPTSGGSWEYGVKWRIKSDAEASPAREISPMPNRPSFVRTASNQTTTMRPNPIRASEIPAVATETPASRLNDPIGGRVRQASADEGLNGPVTVARRDRAETASDEIASETGDEAADTAADTAEPARPVPTASRQDTAGCDRIYNERDCCEGVKKCEDARARLRADSIDKISLDITPSFKPDVKDAQQVEREREKLLDQTPVRAFHTRNGKLLITGRFVRLVHGRVIIRNDEGEELPFRFRDLSDDDLCFISAWWGLPTECRLGGGQMIARQWTPATVTWKASALCHKPLYFEETQLERYGHTTGPISQPVISSAHFFTNIATLPYKMGINPPNECQYSLGYYRPGSCAPWFIPPVPLSVRGALMEAGAWVGGVYVLP